MKTMQERLTRAAKNG